jgi:hypothetical protein
MVVFCAAPNYTLRNDACLSYRHIRSIKNYNEKVKRHASQAPEIAHLPGSIPRPQSAPFDLIPPPVDIDRMPRAEDFRFVLGYHGGFGGCARPDSHSHNYQLQGNPLLGEVSF